jgi:hypothetical protein
MTKNRTIGTVTENDTKMTPVNNPETVGYFKAYIRVIKKALE